MTLTFSLQIFLQLGKLGYCPGYAEKLEFANLFLRRDAWIIVPTLERRGWKQRGKNHKKKIFRR